MTEHKALPVKGYTSQDDQKVDVVNGNKELEERALRRLDFMTGDSKYDQRMIAIARTKMQDAWMWANRAVFQPGRISLPDDED